MARQKKIKTVHIEEKREVIMSDEQVLDGIQTEIDLARIELEKTKVEIEEKKKDLERVGARRELDSQEKAIVAKQLVSISESTSKNAVIEAQKVLDNQQVTGRFLNRRSPGSSVKLTYMKYADDPVKWYPFEDGKVYTIPRGFADQINEHYYSPQFIQKETIMDPNRPDSAIHEVDTSNKKYAFVAVGY